MTQTIDLICFNCKHYTLVGCVAFPDGIPDEILLENKHDKPLPEQDNELVYEPIKNTQNEG